MAAENFPRTTAKLLEISLGRVPKRADAETVGLQVVDQIRDRLQAAKVPLTREAFVEVMTGVVSDLLPEGERDNILEALVYDVAALVFGASHGQE